MSSNVKDLKVKDTGLINEICDLGDIVIDKDRRWSIQFDDYGIQGVVDAIRKDLVEQVCSDSEVDTYRNTLEQGLHLLCDVMGVDVDRYDTDEADYECYLDCFRDASEMLRGIIK